MKKILIVEDEGAIIETLREVLQLKGYWVEAVSQESQALPRALAFDPDLILLDLDLRGDGKDRGGLRVLKQLREQAETGDVPVIVISGVGDTKLLRELMKNRAQDYESKPIEFPPLLDKIERFLRAGTAAGDGTKETGWEEDIVGKSRVMLELTKKLLRAARDECHTLIRGETGTGKDLLARCYHRESPRAGKPFLLIDCTAISRDLFESELFGHAKGAFTGAGEERKGKLEAADGGIVFFNEIGELPSDQQAKLLTLLDSKVITRLGSTEKRQLDILILAATNRDLEQMVRVGTFREDLYYRLHKHVLFVPPLREHIEDIPLLVADFIRKYAQASRRSIHGMEPELLDRLKQYEWKGNVRQLESVVADGVRNSVDDRITWEDVKDSLLHAVHSGTGAGRPPVGADLEVDYEGFKLKVQDVKSSMYREYLCHHLQKHHWRVTETARSLGLSRENLAALMKTHNLRTDTDPEKS